VFAERSDSMLRPSAFAILVSRWAAKTCSGKEKQARLEVGLKFEANALIRNGNP
jgi:hypothetical protein